MYDVAHGKFYYLPTLGARNVGHLDDARRDVTRRRVLPDLRTDRVGSFPIEHQTVPQLHEQHDPLVAIPLLPNDEALQHVRQLFHLPVDLRRADPHTAWVED